MTKTYKLFPEFGTTRLVDLMPRVLAAGLEPALFATIVKGRIDGHLSFNKWYDTGSAVLYSWKGNAKVGLDMETQREFWKLVCPDANKDSSVIALPAGFYENASARLELSQKDIAHYTCRMTEAVARKNEVLMAEITDHDLREAYITSIFRKVKDIHNEDTAKCVWSIKAPLHDAGRLWYIDSPYYLSYNFGNHYIDYTNGRLVGVQNDQQVIASPETRGQRKNLAPAKSLDSTIKAADDAKKPFA